MHLLPSSHALASSSAGTAELLARGAGVTVIVTLITTALALALGVWLATVRIDHRRPRRLGAASMVEVFRGVPALIQIIFWAFAVPTLFPPGLRQTLFFANPAMDGLGAITGLAIPYYAVAAGLGLTLNTAGHLAEIVRAGITTLPSEHVDAARTLGASRRAVRWGVLVPDGLRAGWPAVSTRLVHNMKNTALVSFVAVPDLFHAMQEAIASSFTATRLLTLTAGIYLLLSAAMGLALAAVGRVLQRGRGHVARA